MIGRFFLLKAVALSRTAKKLSHVALRAATFRVLYFRMFIKTLKMGSRESLSPLSYLHLHRGGRAHLCVSLTFFQSMKWCRSQGPLPTCLPTHRTQIYSNRVAQSRAWDSRPKLPLVHRREQRALARGEDVNQLESSWDNNCSKTGGFTRSYRLCTSHALRSMPLRASRGRFRTSRGCVPAKADSSPGVSERKSVPKRYKPDLLVLGKPLLELLKRVSFSQSLLAVGLKNDLLIIKLETKDERNHVFSCSTSSFDS